ncbi:Fibroblast Growth Factor 22 [Manis pentadactyla]|nr:Fibroblast Growth Factor 22 [Manis pentadactyla]
MRASCRTETLSDSEIPKKAVEVGVFQYKALRSGWALVYKAITLDCQFQIRTSQTPLRGRTPSSDSSWQWEGIEVGSEGRTCF